MLNKPNHSSTHELKQIQNNLLIKPDALILLNGCYNSFFMIYVTFRKSMFDDAQLINNIWEVKENNVPQLYIDFIHEKAKEINVIINPHWLNLMNWQDHNNHLSIGEYGNKEKQWNKITRQWNIDKFISEVLHGRKQYFNELNRF